MTQRPTVLLVEDDPLDVEIVELANEAIGSPFGLVSVPNGVEAIDYLCRNGKYADRVRFPNPALMLLDLKMPIADGFQVLRWIQCQPPENMPPVVVLSYSKLPEDVQLAKKLGAKFYALKSPTLEATVGLLRSVRDFWMQQVQPDPARPGVQSNSASASTTALNPPS